MHKRVIISLCILLSGIIIYYLFSENILTKNNVILSIIRNYLPDILWTISFYFMSVNFSKKIVKNYILFTGLYVFLISLLFEIFQFLHIVKGTFDVLDIFVYATSIVAACLIEKKLWRNENEKS